jgi:chemotaxis protein methyltransferase CheR
MLDQIDVLSGNKLNAVLKEKYNVDYSGFASSSYRRRVPIAMTALGAANVDDLILKLVADKDAFQVFSMHLRVECTELFRDPSFWRQLKEQVGPKLNAHQTIRIWVPHFSSGEELYSLLIWLKEQDCLDKTKVIATEVNDKLFEKLQSGKYSSKDFELAKSNYERYGGTKDFSAYCKEVDGAMQMDTSLLKNVQFKVNFLGYDEAPGKFDLVLCRNVILLFNNKLQELVLKQFYDAIIPGGFLAIGVKESIEGSDYKKHFNAFSADEKIFQKIN